MVCFYNSSIWQSDWNIVDRNPTDGCQMLDEWLNNWMIRGRKIHLLLKCHKSRHRPIHGILAWGKPFHAANLYHSLGCREFTWVFRTGYKIPLEFVELFCWRRWVSAWESVRNAGKLHLSFEVPIIIKEIMPWESKCMRDGELELELHWCTFREVNALKY